MLGCEWLAGVLAGGLCRVGREGKMIWIFAIVQGLFDVALVVLVGILIEQIRIRNER